MTVIIEKSICKDCKGLLTCQRLKRLNYSHSIRDEMTKVFGGISTTGNSSNVLIYRKENRPEEVFEIIIVTCSMKDQYITRKLK